MTKLAPAALVLLLAPTLQGAQRTTFVGIVTDSLARDPLPGVSVVLVEKQLATTTNAADNFHLEGVDTGLHTVLVRYPGYEAWAIRLNVRVVEDIEVDIGPVVLTPVAALELDTLYVEGETMTPGLAGFEHRMRSEKGTFITAADIERLNPRRTSDLLRTVAAFRTDRRGDVASVRGIPSLLHSGACAVEYYIDGVHSGLSSLDHINPNSIAAVEIYRGASTTPTLFQGTGNSKCGVIAIWTKHGRGPR